MQSQLRGGTRWKRFAVVMVPSIAATAAIGVGLSQGALAASFSVSGQSFKVTADRLEGDGFNQYGSMDKGVTLDGKETYHPVAVSAFKSADIINMCQSVVTPHVPVFGNISLRLTAGTGDTPVKAENLYIDVESLETTSAEFKNIDIGVAAGQASKGPELSAGANGNGFAQQADSAVLTGVKQTAWATTAGTFNLSNLNMSLKTGVHECY
ncbi:DUF6230 family protein [Streptomyces sp. UH6]|uniref:DUF6230 family protein n=1 Tax=Streptomyces sp. UH6 TaxID=2748379 RepID=UPI0015D46E64|nr:DUF6230 family protein [Streptomyces sp. UH6]NYV78084.1 cholesterol esterase [Streptomyces sp. UH6]